MLGSLHGFRPLERVEGGPPSLPLATLACSQVSILPYWTLLPGKAFDPPKKDERQEWGGAEVLGWQSVERVRRFWVVQRCLLWILRNVQCFLEKGLLFLKLEMKPCRSIVEHVGWQHQVDLGFSLRILWRSKGFKELHLQAVQLQWIVGGVQPISFWASSIAFRLPFESWSLEHAYGTIIQKTLAGVSRNQAFFWEDDLTILFPWWVQSIFRASGSW